MESLSSVSLAVGTGIGLFVGMILVLVGIGNNRRLKKDVLRLEKQLLELMRIHGDERSECEKELDKLERENTELRGAIEKLKRSPTNDERYRLRVCEAAVAQIEAQAPGFKTAWDTAVKEAEKLVAPSGSKPSLRERVFGV